MNIEVNKLLTF